MFHQTQLFESISQKTDISVCQLRWWTTNNQSNQSSLLLLAAVHQLQKAKSGQSWHLAVVHTVWYGRLFWESFCFGHF